VPFHVLYGERSDHLIKRSGLPRRCPCVSSWSLPHAYCFAFLGDAFRALPFRLQLDVLLDRPLPVTFSRISACQKPDPV